MVPIRCKPLSIFLSITIAIAASFAMTVRAALADVIAIPEPDPHYTKVGFFDLHVCNWPNRPLMFLMLFSTYDYQSIAKVEVFYPDGRVLGQLDTKQFRVVRKKAKPEKRVFMKFMDVPEGSEDGWYKAQVTMKDGKKYLSRDLVAITSMELPSQFDPPHQAEDIIMPKQLSWQPVPGAKAYQVFLKDIWDGEKDVMPSKIVTQAHFVLPPDLLKPGGYYKWRVQARDVNENTLLGDFNHGSLTAWSEFTVAE